MRKLLASKETLEKSAKNYFMRRENILGKANRFSSVQCNELLIPKTPSRTMGKGISLRSHIMEVTNCIERSIQKMTVLPLNAQR